MAGGSDEVKGAITGGGRLSGSEAAELTRHVAELGRAGLPLPSGLRALAEEVDPGRLRQSLEDLAGSIEAGQSLDEAMRTQNNRLPGYLRGLVLAGVRTGRLGEALERASRHHNLDAELRRGLWLTLAYPLALLAAVCGLGLFVAAMVIRPIVEIFTDFGVDLPQITQTLIHVTEAATETGWLMVAGAIGGLLLVTLAAGSFGKGPWKRSLTSIVPLFGPLWRWTALADFTRLLGLLLENDVPLPEALALTGAGARDRDVDAACQGLRAEVERGRSLAEAFGRRRELPNGLARLIGWAEASRSLPGALNLAGDLYEARARAQARFVGLACTSLAILAVLWGAIFVIFALFLPLIRLVSALSG